MISLLLIPDNILLDYRHLHLTLCHMHKAYHRLLMIRLRLESLHYNNNLFAYKNLIHYKNMHLFIRHTHRLLSRKKTERLSRAV